nr:cupredoxin family protein [uncultured Roseateles sp.]
MTRTHTACVTLLSALLLGSGAAVAHGGKHADSPTKFEQKDWGIAGRAKAVTRTLTVRMSDAMRFIPDQLAVKQGETVRIEIRNEGAMLHEFVLGTKPELDAHAALMLKFPDMEHDEPYMAHVPAGKTGEIVWTFNRAGEFDFACLIAGHYQAGMVGKLRVTASKAAK